MFYADHNPPHFHVEHQGEHAVFDFKGNLLAGEISSRTARQLVKKWADQHRLELMINWKLQQQGKQLNRIEPLE
jgi:hypothetical protein